MPKSPVKPTVGRIVHYVPNPGSGLGESHNGAELLPAIVVRTWEHSSYQNDELNLKVFLDGPSDLWKTSVPYNEEKLPGTWHWPPRA